MIPYADTNFLASLYLDVGPFELARQQLAAAQVQQAAALPINSILWCEMINAFELHAYHARHGGQWRVTSETAAVASAIFEGHIEESDFYLLKKFRGSHYAKNSICYLSATPPNTAFALMMCCMSHRRVCWNVMNSGASTRKPASLLFWKVCESTH